MSREKTQIHVHIASSSSRANSNAITRGSQVLRQFVIENAFSMLHIHAFQHALSFLLELLHSVPMLRKQASSELSENLLAQTQLYDVMLLSLAVDRACGKPFVNFLARLMETDDDKANSLALVSCATMMHELVDYAVNESPFGNEAVSAQTYCSGVGNTAAFVLRREYLAYLQVSYTALLSFRSFESLCSIHILIFVRILFQRKFY